MDTFLEMLLLLAMTTLTVGVNPTPVVIRGFVRHPAWSQLIGEQIRQDCLQAVTQFPEETDGILAFTFARVFFSGSCALGVFVTLPDPTGITVVTETWPNIRGWTRGSVDLNTGARRGGWELNLRSGVQVCFYEPAYVDTYRMCSMDTPYQRNHALTLANCLHIISPPRQDNLGSRPLPQSTLDDPLRQVTGIPPSATPLRILPSTDDSGNADVEIGLYKSVPEWGGPTMIPELDCKDAIKLVPAETLWRTSRSEFYMRFPEAYRTRQCALGMFYTNPTAIQLARKARAQGMVFHIEAFRLMLGTTTETPGGGFVDLRNGLQIVLYEPDFIDPQSLCSHMNSMSLKACLDGLVKFQARQADAGSSST